ncbi:metallophosphoesterase [Mucisphaera calidilacus]|uniref:Calcineurin-like phosphoesterase domain-containing protein n=1 Tax=Mucisphaera calidilacus TaxID=2527982 RepID=A0A518BVJ8_9BACT|nr:metallophosphoesterase [Mucisphaera calidilacus]QDU71005.1 hypothetical protein Pan265_08500 [Mucisphaera calidilacus]
MKIFAQSVAVAVSLAVGAQAGAEVFRFVSLPDTQIYSENRFPSMSFPPITDPAGTATIFSAQTQWIVDNAEAMNIRYVGHLGDIVQNAQDPARAPQEWANAKAAMDKLLDADIPHGTVMGNHDDEEHGEDYNAGYLANFGPQVFAGRSWYTDSSPGGGGNYQLMDHEGQKIGFLNFSIDQPQAEIDWANNIIRSNPDTLFVLGTHRYMYDYKLIAGRYNEENITPLGTFVVKENFAPGVPDGNYGQQMYEKLVVPNDNVFMLHAGHFHSEWMRLSGSFDSVVEETVEILTDYQDARNGGDGWMRIYEIDLESSTFSWKTYSPTLDEYRSTLHHFVETIQQAWIQRDQVKALLGFGSDAEYLGFLEANLKDNPLIPDNFLALHPDWDADYFNAYLADMFNVPNGGSIPAGFENILEWENLWMLAFAADPTNPLDFSDGLRSPSGSLAVNYNAFVPEPASLALLSLGAAMLMRRR